MSINLTAAMRDACRAMHDGAELRRLTPGKTAELLTQKGDLVYTRTLAAATVKRLEESDLIKWTPLAIVGGPTLSKAQLTERGRKAGKPEAARFKARITTPTMVSEMEGPLTAMSDMLLYVNKSEDREGVIRRCIEAHSRSNDDQLLDQLKTIRIGLVNRCPLSGASTGFTRDFWVAIEAVLRLMPRPTAKPDTGEDPVPKA